ncbi:MAG: hypothetical protein KTR31_16910 [Myxococcales bacterium]|nr:hypothetical protein [Myxococcales bacterium]
MIRWILPMVCCAWSCELSEPGDPGAIEITGYLDASRVTWTSDADTVQAAGGEGVAPASAWLLLSNLTSGDAERARASAVGAFAVGVQAIAGDRLELSLLDAQGSDVAAHDVPVERPPFPETVQALARVDPHADAAAVVEVVFEPPQWRGHVWAVNRSLDGVVEILTVLDAGRIHGGRLRALQGHEVWLYWVPVEGQESRPLALTVRPADP